MSRVNPTFAETSSFIFWFGSLIFLLPYLENVMSLPVGFRISVISLSSWTFSLYCKFQPQVQQGRSTRGYVRTGVVSHQVTVSADLASSCDSLRSKSE
jgi:hypothetical protein